MLSVVHLLLLAFYIALCRDQIVRPYSMVFKVKKEGSMKYISVSVVAVRTDYLAFVEFPKFSSFSNCTLQEGKSQILDEPPKLMSF